MYWVGSMMMIVIASARAIPVGAHSAGKPKLDHPLGIRALLLFLGIVTLGLFFAAYSIAQDIAQAGTAVTTWVPFLLLGVALLIALGFEFVNGFHDSANAVATVIDTHSLPAPIAVVWSGFFNFRGVLASTGAVAFCIVSLLPVEPIMQVGSQAGFAMVFAMLIAAIIWNLGTWWLGRPASSSHTLIGSIIGVGVANARTRWHVGDRLGQGDRHWLRLAAVAAIRLFLRRRALADHGIPSAQA